MTPASDTAMCAKCRLEYAGDALFCPNCGTAKSRKLDGDPVVGTRVGERYLVVERIGHGTSGTIYRGEHITLRRRVAVKVLHHELSRDDLAIERFRREATTVGQIDNDHIVEIFDFGRTIDGRLYIAMELLDGEPLADLLEREGRLPVDRAVDILIQLGEALAEAHAMGYVHRDLRPRNVFLTRRRGRNDFVKLLDFGLAKLVERDGEAASTSLGMTFGDPRYMSPEQASGNPVDRRADIYSVGCIAYEMLVGEPPFLGEKVFDVLEQHLHEPPVPLSVHRPEVPLWLESAVMCALAKRADERFASVHRLMQALREGSQHGRVMSMELARQREPEPPMPAAAVAVAASAPGASAVGASAASAAAPPMSARALARAEIVDEPDAGRRVSARVDQITAAAAIAESPFGYEPADEEEAGDDAGGSLAQAWFADGDDFGADGPRRRGDAPTSASGTGLIGYDEVYVPRRRLGAIAIGAAVLVAAGIAGAAWWATRDPGAPRTRAAAVPSPAAAPPAAAPPAAEPPAAEPSAAAASPAEPSAPAPTAVEPTAVDPAPPAAAEPRHPDHVAAAAPPRAASPSPPAATKPKPPAAATPPHGGEHPGNITAIIGSAARSRQPSETQPPSDDEPMQPYTEPSSPATPPGGTAPSGTEETAQADFYVKLGNRALRAGDIVGAATHFHKAREIDGANADAVVGLGEIALTQGLYTDAISHLRRAVSLAPHNSRAHRLLGEAYLGSDQRDKAAASFKRALQIDPDDADARRGYQEAIGDSAASTP